MMKISNLSLNNIGKTVSGSGGGGGGTYEDFSDGWTVITRVGVDGGTLTFLDTSPVDTSSGFIRKDELVDTDIDFEFEGMGGTSQAIFVGIYSPETTPPFYVSDIWPNPPFGSIQSVVLELTQNASTNSPARLRVNGDLSDEYTQPSNKDGTGYGKHRVQIADRAVSAWFNDVKYVEDAPMVPYGVLVLGWRKVPGLYNENPVITNFRWL